jgi:hypothetical protein
MIIFLLLVVVVIGNLYFQLHSLPERIAHRGHHVQMQLVAVLCLLALFTHNNVFWIAALLLAMVHLPDFTTPINSIAQSLEKMAGGPTTAPDIAAADQPAMPASATTEVAAAATVNLAAAAAASTASPDPAKRLPERPEQKRA